MRTRSAMLLATAALGAGLLTGCGGSKDNSKDKGAGSGTSAPGKGGSDTHTVTLEVTGEAGEDTSIGIHYYLENMDTVARAKLPWSKTARLDIVGAEHTVGRLVNVVPGTVRSSSGEFVSASCAIKVDGKTVVSKKGARAKPTICDYKLK